MPTLYLVWHEESRDETLEIRKGQNERTKTCDYE